jgi:hypothetical protein
MITDFGTLVLGFTWGDTINGRIYASPSWVDYIREWYNMAFWGNGYNGREILSADTGMETIQRYAHLPANTRHIIFAGINEMYNGSVTLQSMKDDIQSAVDEVQAQGHIPIVISLPPVDEATDTGLTDSATVYSDYKTWLAGTFAAAEGILVIDPAVVMATTGTRDLKPEYQTDALHWNNYGHQVMADYISTKINTYFGP